MIRHGNHIMTYGRRGDSVVKSIRKGDTIIYMEGLSANAIDVILNSYGRDSLYAMQDYIKLHPNVIPFVNEDPHIACSLVDTGYERWIVTGGSGCYFNTGLVAANYPITIKTRVYLNDTGSTVRYIFGNNSGSSTSNTLYFSFAERYSAASVFSGATTWQNVGTINAKTEYNVTYSLTGFSGKKVIIDGTEYTDTSENSGYSAIYNPIGIFSQSGVRASSVPTANSRITHADIQLNDNTFLIIPFKRDGNMEMLNITTGELCVRNGTFTELIKQKNS